MKGDEKKKDTYVHLFIWSSLLLEFEIKKVPSEGSNGSYTLSAIIEVPIIIYLMETEEVLYHTYSLCPRCVILDRKGILQIHILFVLIVNIM